MIDELKAAMANERTRQNMIPFILDADGVAELRRIRAYGESSPLSFHTLKKIMEGIQPVPGDDDNHICFLPPIKDWPNRFKVVFSVEEQPVGKLRHMSCSIIDSDTLPSPHAVGMVMKELGFKRELDKCGRVWIEEKPMKAINVLDFYD